MMRRVTAAPDLEQQLLDAVARAPDDDEPRLVLADYWLSGPDPERGELVALQLAGPDAGKLIERNRSRWLGALATADFAKLELVRGFLRQPLALVPGDPLLADPQTRRIAPRIYVLDRRLGSKTREIHLAATPGGEDVVIKAPRRMRQSIGDLSCAIVHPHVVELRDVASTRMGQAAVYAWAGEPMHVAPLPRARVIELGRQVASGLAALHAAGILHLDLNASHVLVAGDHARLGGLANACRALSLPAGETRNGGRMTVDMAPEMLGTGLVGQGSDVYTLGLVLAGWLLGRHPIGWDIRGNPRALLDRVRNAQLELPDDAVLRPLLAAMTAVERTARPTAAEVTRALAALVA